MILITMAIAAAAMQARVVHADGLTALKISGRVYSLGGEQPLRIGDDVVQAGLSPSFSSEPLASYAANADRTQKLRLIRGGKEIGAVDLTKLADKWLNDDGVWGGHENGNQVRYLVNRYGGVLRCDLTECLPNPDGSALCVLSLRYSDAWQLPTPAQVLIHVTRNPFRIADYRFLKWMGAPDPPPPGAVRRLYKVARKEFLIDGMDVLQVRPDGTAVATAFTLPPLTVPAGLSASRWLVSQQQLDNRGSRQWIATDFLTGTTRTILRCPYVSYPASTETTPLGLRPRSCCSRDESSNLITLCISQFTFPTATSIRSQTLRFAWLGLIR